MVLPIVVLSLFSSFYLYQQYQVFLEAVEQKKMVQQLLSVSNVQLELNRESQDMRSFFLGLRTFDQMQKQKDRTDQSIEDLKKRNVDNINLLEVLNANLEIPLSSLRDRVLSGQVSWPDASLTIGEIEKGFENLIEVKTNGLSTYFQKENFELNRLQEALISSRELKNDLSFVIIRDMPLNSIQFGKLISSYERSVYFKDQARPFLINGNETMKFSYHQQEIIWSKIEKDYQKAIGTVDQGRYNINLSTLNRQFERLENAQFAPIQKKRHLVLEQAMSNLGKYRTYFMMSFMFVVGFVILTAKMSMVYNRRMLFYLVSGFTNHEINFASKDDENSVVSPLIFPPLGEPVYHQSDREEKKIA